MTACLLAFFRLLIARSAICAAFLPRFIVPGPDAVNQLRLLAVTFLVVAIVLDSLWAVLAGRLRALLAGFGRACNRLTGGLLIGAGLGLALARRA